MSNNRKAFKAAIWYTVSSIALKAISVISAPIFTRLLTPTDYGKFNNFFSWQTILACVFGLCLNYSIGRAKIDYKNDFNGFITSIQTLSILTGLTLLFFALPFLDSLVSLFELDKGLIISLLVMLIVSPSIDFLQSKYRFEYRYKENIIIALINSLGVLLLSVCFILLSDLEFRYVGRIMGSVVPILLIGLFAVTYIYSKGKKFVNIEYWRYALRISLPMMPHGLAMVLLAQIDRIMLIKMDSFDAAGLYSFGYSYALIVSIFTNAIMNAWQPWLYDMVSEAKYGEIIKSNRKINILAFVISISLIAIGPEVIMILGSEPFYDVKWMVAPVIAGCFFQFLYGYFSLMELYCKRTELIAIGSIGAAAFKIILNFYFIPRYGYIGAAYTTMLSYAILYVFHWSMFKIIFKYKIFAECQIFVLAILSSVFVIVFAKTYDTITIRYTLFVGLLVCFAVVYRKTLKNSKRFFLNKFFNNSQHEI